MAQWSSEERRLMEQLQARAQQEPAKGPTTEFVPGLLTGIILTLWIVSLVAA